MTQPEKLLRELIALPSVNPAFLPAGDARAGEKRVADFLATTAGRAGLDVDLHKVLPGRSNFLARLTPSGTTTKRVVLAPHMDTVPPVSNEQLNPIRDNDRLFGRGACDTKGSVAAMLSALMLLAREKNRPKNTEIVFVGLIDEENAQAGSRAFAASGFKADLAIVGEPTRNQIVTAHKGSLWLQFETRGKAAHGARPDLGVNAVHEMARIVDVLQSDYAKMLRGKKHRLLGHPTISVGSINGGTQPNIVPAKCVASADRRLLPGETQASVFAEIQALLRKRGLQTTIGCAKNPGLPMEANLRLPLVQQFLKSAKQAKPAGVDYFCDASVLAHGGIPSVVFGPGDIAQAHTSNEWISIRSLNQATEMLLNFLRSLA
ncbi:MAG: Peptidase dimerization domain protein [Verrucomicrobiales bacterium]|nr:Peptidase dimerization domain protein [Verrucomicrobiales bacterium]